MSDGLRQEVNLRDKLYKEMKRSPFDNRIKTQFNILKKRKFKKQIKILKAISYDNN